MEVGALTLRHLRIFLAVCQEGAVTAAAEKLYIAQPTVSVAIRELERRGFIYTQPCYRSHNGLIQQTSNTYYILDLPDISKPKEEVTIIRGEIRGSGAEKSKAG